MALKESKTTLTDVGVGGGDVQASHTSLLSQSSQQIARQQLAQAREILRLGLENVNYARTAVALNDGKSIADVSWIKVGASWCSYGIGTGPGLCSENVLLPCHLGMLVQVVGLRWSASSWT